MKHNGHIDHEKKKQSSLCFTRFDLNMALENVLRLQVMALVQRSNRVIIFHRSAHLSSQWGLEARKKKEEKRSDAIVNGVCIEWTLEFHKALKGEGQLQLCPSPNPTPMTSPVTSIVADYRLMSKREDWAWVLIPASILSFRPQPFSHSCKGTV